MGKHCYFPFPFPLLVPASICSRLRSSSVSVRFRPLRLMTYRLYIHCTAMCSGDALLDAPLGLATAAELATRLAHQLDLDGLDALVLGSFPPRTGRSCAASPAADQPDGNPLRQLIILLVELPHALLPSTELKVFDFYLDRARAV